VTEPNASVQESIEGLAVRLREALRSSRTVGGQVDGDLVEIWVSMEAGLAAMSLPKRVLRARVATVGDRPVLVGTIDRPTVRPTAVILGLVIVYVFGAAPLSEIIATRQLDLASVISIGISILAVLGIRWEVRSRERIASGREAEVRRFLSANQVELIAEPPGTGWPTAAS
jgi:hypothetical protein